MPVLIIGEEERKRINEIIAYAMAHPVSLETVKAGAAPDKFEVKLEDRKPGYERSPAEHMIFPGNYRAAFSIENQPPGLCTHLSISVFGRSKPGQMPGEAAVAMICEAFGVPFPPDQLWLEEFDPGEHALNLMSLIDRKAIGK